MASYLVLGGSGGRALVLAADSTPQPGQPPPTPSGVAVAVVSSSRIDLSWQAVPTAASYLLQRSTDNLTWSSVGTPTGTGLSDQNLLAGTTYYYRVRASNVYGDSAYCTSSSGTTPAASYSPQVLPSYLALGKAKAQANTGQWSQFKARLDGWMTTLTGYNYGGNYTADPTCLPVAGLALGYRCLKDVSPGTAMDYADRAVGLMKLAVRSHLGEFDGSYAKNHCQFLAFGDGSTTTFTVPDADFVPATLRAWVSPLKTATVVKGGDGGMDRMDSNFYGFKYINSKVVNITTSASDTHLSPSTYAFGTDCEWWKHYGSPAYKNPGFNVNFLALDWSVGSHQPPPGSTYYVRLYDLALTTMYTAPTNMTRSGTSFTLPSAPAVGDGVFVSYLYGTRAPDYSTLAYQTTFADDGGFWSVSPGNTYNSRYFYALAMAVDWLWDYPGFSGAVKGEVLGMLVRWADHVGANGYGRGAVASNYGAGHVLFRSCLAAALNGRTTDGTRLAGELASYYASSVATALGPAPFHTVPDLDNPPDGDPLHTTFYADTYATMKGGFVQEGFNYGGGTTQDLVTGVLVLGDSGIVPDISATRTWADEAVRFNLMARPTQTTLLGAGDDGKTYPVPWFTATAARATAPDVVSTLAGACSDPSCRAMINHAIQSGARPSTPFWRDLLFRDPTATATDPATALPLSYRCGVVISRADWSYQSTVALLHCDSPLPSDHEDMRPGHLEVKRGGDDLLINPSVRCGYATGGSFGRSQYGNMVVLDDNGDGLLAYRWGMAYDFGPAEILQGYEAQDGYTYAYVNNRSGWSKPRSNQATNLCLEGTRSFLHVRPDLVFTVDRNTTTGGKSYPKQLRSNTMNAATLSGDSWKASSGSSTLFGSHYSGVPLLTTTGAQVLGGVTYYRTVCTPATQLDRWVVASVFQAAPSTTTNPDPSALVASGDGQLVGVVSGQTLALFAQASGVPVVTPVSYSFTGQAGTTTHYLCELPPGQAYTLSGADQATATSSPSGVLSFTTTGSGPKTVMVT